MYTKACFEILLLSSSNYWGLYILYINIMLVYGDLENEDFHQNHLATQQKQTYKFIHQNLDFV